MQKIHIKNFGPIRDVELDIHDAIFLIGPQASGKSTISKAIWFFRSLRYDMGRTVGTFDDSGNDDLFIYFQKNILVRFRSLFGKVKLDEGFFMKFCYGNGVEVSLVCDEEFPLVRLGDSFKDKLKTVYEGMRVRRDDSRKEKDEYGLSRDAIIHRNAVLNNLIYKDAFSFFDDYVGDYFMPAGRITSTGSSETLVGKISNDLMVSLIEAVKYKERLGMGYEFVRNERKKFYMESILEDHLDLAEELIASILCGEYRSHRGVETLKINDKKQVDLAFASSGQQESLWVLQTIFLLILDKVESALIVEEPEAHLFPEAQRNIVALMSLFLSAMPRNQFVITTHSPYILSSANNLLYAHQVGQKKPEETGKIVDPKLWMDPKRVGAYFVENGGIRSIMDDELGMMRAEEIDSVSRKINEEFDRLFDLDNEVSE
ncbi:MAG: AAA family ATPase [Magnetococcales bacterium]|nr:AAA family ATPase [Magnetococcales bacterium]